MPFLVVVVEELNPPSPLGDKSQIKSKTCMQKFAISFA